jgi:TonB family protein
LKVTQFGRELANEFALSLSAASSGKFKVLDRSLLPDFIRRQNLPPIVTGFAWGAFPADKFGAQTLIQAELSILPEKPSLQLELQCFRTKSSRKKVAEFQTEFQATSQTKSSLSTVISGTDITQYVEPGKYGVTLPAYLYCAIPPFTQEAFEAKIHGTVILGAVITTAGKAEDIIVLRQLPLGLTESAIKAAKQWKFKPSLGPDGNPVTTWALIEVDFYIFH